MQHMKTIFIFFILTISLNCFAQDSRLFDNQWYLHNLIIDGESNIPPVNDEIPFVPLDFLETGEIYTGICESPGNGTVSYVGTSEFTVQDFAVLAGGCYDSEENEDFNNLYINIYWIENIEGTFLYTIVENGANKTLTITNSSGDEAIYGNMLLTTEDHFTPSFTIYPNPTGKKVFIQKGYNTTINNLKILDINGRLIYSFSQFISEVPAINVQSLKNGIYFITIEDEQSRVITKRFIKE